MKVRSSDSDSSSSSVGSSSGSETSDDAEPAVTKKKMPRITKEERGYVCEWLQKERSDGKMFNARWIKNGGAKGQTMTATSAEVKTSGAYESLATLWLRLFLYFVTSCLRRYVNRKLRLGKKSTWTKDVAKKRFAALLVACCCLFLCFK